MAKSIDLSGLKKQTVSRPSASIIDEAVKSIHEQEERAAREPKEKIVRITVDLPESLHMQLKMRAVQEKTTIRKYVIGLLKEKLQ